MPSINSFAFIWYPAFLKDASGCSAKRKCLPKPAALATFQWLSGELWCIYLREIRRLCSHRFRHQWPSSTMIVIEWIEDGVILSQSKCQHSWIRNRLWQRRSPAICNHDLWQLYLQALLISYSNLRINSHIWYPLSLKVQAPKVSSQIKNESSSLIKWLAIKFPKRHIFNNFFQLKQI